MITQRDRASSVNAVFTSLGSRCSRFRRYIYNHRNHTCCERRPLNWCCALLFLVAFPVGVLAALYFLQYNLQSHIKYNHKKRPWVDKTDVMQQSYPGLLFIPNLVGLNAHVIWYTFRGHRNQYNMKPQVYIKYLNKYLLKYEEAENNSLSNPNSPYVNCSFDTGRPDGKVCLFRRSELTICGSPDYGYNDRKPCFLLKINKLFDWKPIGFDQGKLPKDMPDSLKKIVNDIGARDFLWVSCKGQHPLDTEHLGRVLYFPQQGFPGYYFPYDGHKRYMSPLVAVQLEEIAIGTVVKIECQMWAKNIPAHSERGTERIIVSVYIDK